MDCPKCKSVKSFLLVEDKIICHDCSNEITIGYWVCNECGYSFRTNDGEFMDGAVFDVEILEDLTSSLEEFEEVSEISSMSDLLNPCVKCGSLTSYKSGENEFTCSDCGFIWEILSNE